MRRGRTRWAQAALAGCVSLVVLGWPAKALAHGVELDHEQADAVLVEATYDTGEPLADAQVTVYSPEDSSDPWMTGSIDDEGNFLFVPAEAGTWQVEVRHAGHGDVLEIPVEESGISSAEDEGAAQEQEKDAPKQEDTVPDEGAGAGGSATSSWGGTGPLQIVVMSALAIWGFLGTALYFTNRKRA